MAPKRKADGALKLAASAADVADRLGSLPDDVIGHILSFLPSAQAVLTYQLSRRWRRLSAHVLALNLSVLDNGGRHPSRFRSFAREALARFPTVGIPSVSLEFGSRSCIADGWYGEAMERAVGSVRITVPRRGPLSRLEFPRCTRAEALTMRLTHGVNLELPAAGPVLPFGSLTELSLSSLLLPANAGTPPFHEFLSSCCPRLKRLRLCCVRGDAVRVLVLRSDVLEALDLISVDDLARLDVVAANLRSLSVRSCFRFPVAGADEDDTAVVVSAPRIEAICWYRSYPKRLEFPAGLTHVRRLTGLKLPTLGRNDQFDFPYTRKLLHACSLTTEYLELDFIVPDEMTLRNWSGSGQEGSCEDLMAYVPQLPAVTVLSLNIRWGFSGNIGPSLVSLLSRISSVTHLYILSSPYCRTVLESQDVLPRRGQYPWGFVRTDEKLCLDCVREISIGRLKGTDEQEFRIIELLLGATPPLLERVSLTFDDTATPIIDDVASEILANFPMATGRWVRSSLLITWTKRNVKSFI